jgi:hypothetical protein
MLVLLLLLMSELLLPPMLMVLMLLMLLPLLLELLAVFLGRGFSQSVRESACRSPAGLALACLGARCLGRSAI